MSGFDSRPRHQFHGPLAVGTHTGAKRSLHHEMRYKNTVSGCVDSSSVMLPSSPRSAAEAFGWRNCEALLNLFLSYETQILERS
jgi:hypothetical protein